MNIFSLVLKQYIKFRLAHELCNKLQSSYNSPFKNINFKVKSPNVNFTTKSLNVNLYFIQHINVYFREYSKILLKYLAFSKESINYMFSNSKKYKNEIIMLLQHYNSVFEGITLGEKEIFYICKEINYGYGGIRFSNNFVNSLCQEPTGVQDFLYMIKNFSIKHVTFEHTSFTIPTNYQPHTHKNMNFCKVIADLVNGYDYKENDNVSTVWWENNDVKNKNLLFIGAINIYPELLSEKKNDVQDIGSMNMYIPTLSSTKTNNVQDCIDHCINQLTNNKINEFIYDIFNIANKYEISISDDILETLNTQMLEKNILNDIFLW